MCVESRFAVLLVAVACAACAAPDEGESGGGSTWTQAVEDPTLTCAQTLAAGQDDARCGSIPPEQMQAAAALVVHMAGRDFRARVEGVPAAAYDPNVSYTFCLPSATWAGVAGAGPVRQTIESRSGLVYECRGVRPAATGDALVHAAVRDPGSRLYDPVVLTGLLPDPIRARAAALHLDAARQWELLVMCGREDPAPGGGLCRDAARRAVEANVFRPSMDNGFDAARDATELLRYDPTGSPELAGFYRDVIQGCFALPAGEADAAYDDRFLSWFDGYEQEPTRNCTTRPTALETLLVGVLNGLALDLQIRLRALSLLLHDDALTPAERAAAAVLVVAPSFGFANAACSGLGARSSAGQWTGCAASIGLTSLDVTLLVAPVVRAAGTLTARLGEAGALAGAREVAGELATDALARAGRFEFSGAVGRALSARGAAIWDGVLTDLRAIRGLESAGLVIEDRAGVLGAEVTSRFTAAGAGANPVRVVILRAGADGMTEVITTAASPGGTTLRLTEGLVDAASGTIYLGPQASRIVLDHEIIHVGDAVASSLWRVASETGTLRAQLFWAATETHAWQFTLAQAQRSLLDPTLTAVERNELLDLIDLALERSTEYRDLGRILVGATSR